MHIAYITSEFATEKARGGLATYLNNITSIMEEHGHKVTVITLSERTGRIQYDKNIEVVRVKAAAVSNADEVMHALSLIHNSWNLYRILKRENKRCRIDVVQAANYQAVGFFRDLSIPTIVRVSSDASLWRNAMQYKFSYEEAIQEKTLSDYLELYCAKWADAVFAPSRFCADAVQKRTKRNVTVIESPYLYKQQKLDESLYNEKLLNKKYLLFNSTLSRLKGTHIGIEATEALLEKYPDLYMVYAGYDYGFSQKEGGIQKIREILAKQHKRYNGRVIYLGRLEHNTLFSLIKHALACVLPSRVDNLPNSCIEAMALESIVIGTYGASFEQLIKNKENGLLIKRDSAVSLTKAVDWIMDLSEKERLEMGKKAHAAVYRLRPEKVYYELSLFYEKVIENFKKKA